MSGFELRLHRLEGLRLLPLTTQSHDHAACLDVRLADFQQFLVQPAVLLLVDCLLVLGVQLGHRGGLGCHQPFALGHVGGRGCQEVLPDVPLALGDGGLDLAHQIDAWKAVGDDRIRLGLHQCHPPRGEEPESDGDRDENGDARLDSIPQSPMRIHFLDLSSPRCTTRAPKNGRGPLAVYSASARSAEGVKLPLSGSPPARVRAATKGYHPGGPGKSPSTCANRLRRRRVIRGVRDDGPGAQRASLISCFVGGTSLMICEGFGPTPR